jgi:hypothetical protein
MLQRGEMRDSLHYARHFGLLTGAIAVLVATVRWRPAGGVASAGLYGALHASALVLSVRAPQRLQKQAIFVAVAASLAMLSVLLAVAAARLSATVPLLRSPLLLLTIAAALGASSYAGLTKSFWLGGLPARAIIILPVGCVMATLLPFTLGAHAPGGGVWLVAAWWLAFSAGVWYYDRGTTYTEVT